MKAHELSGAALDWAVNEAGRYDAVMATREQRLDGHSKLVTFYDYAGDHGMYREYEDFNPSQDWTIAGELLHRFNMSIDPVDENGITSWAAGFMKEPNHAINCGGRTPQEAICRVVVMAKYPDGIEIPAELME